MCFTFSSLSLSLSLPFSCNRLLLCIYSQWKGRGREEVREDILCFECLAVVFGLLVVLFFVTVPKSAFGCDCGFLCVFVLEWFRRCRRRHHWSLCQRSEANVYKWRQSSVTQLSFLTAHLYFISHPPPPLLPSLSFFFLLLTLWILIKNATI